MNTAHAPRPHDATPRVLITVLWAAGRPNSGWEDMPAFVRAWPTQIVEQYPEEFAVEQHQAEVEFERLADVADVFFFTAPMVTSYPVIPPMPAAPYRRFA